MNLQVDLAVVRTNTECVWCVCRVINCELAQLKRFCPPWMFFPDPVSQPHQPANRAKHKCLCGGCRPLAGGQIGWEESSVLCCVPPRVMDVHRFNKDDFEWQLSARSKRKRERETEEDREKKQNRKVNMDSHHSTPAKQRHLLKGKRNYPYNTKMMGGTLIK